MQASQSDEVGRLLEDAEMLLNKGRALSQRVATYSQRLVGESDAFGEEVKSLQAALAGMEEACAEVMAHEDSESLLQSLSAIRNVINGGGPGGDLRRLCKPKSPILVRLLIGDMDLIQLQKDRSVRLKEEYHRFRDRMALIAFLAPALLLVGMYRSDALSHAQARYTLAPPLLTALQVYLGWLVYMYIAMALRENILLLNGSNIRSWWIHHHYWSAAATAVCIAMPIDSPAVHAFAEKFLFWSCFQALVMIMQNRYQRRRMYTRIAMGKQSAMDVVSGESSGVPGQLLLLYPFLFVLQAWQLLLGIQIVGANYHAFTSFEGWLEMERHESDLRGSRGVCIVGVVFALLAVLNAGNTIATILEKRRHVLAKLTRRASRPKIA